MRTKKVFLNLLSEVLPQLIIAVISFVRVKIFLSYIGAVEVQMWGEKKNA